MIVEPEPGFAPLIPPVMVPIVQLKLLGIEATRLIFGLVPLQMVEVLGIVTIGVGLTVTVIGKIAHEPVAEVGVTRYSTVPATVELGLVSV